MEIPGGKSSSPSLSFKYTASNEALVELNNKADEEQPNELANPNLNENASPKRLDKTSLIDKYFKSIRPDKDKDDAKLSEEKPTSSPVKEYLNRLGKKSASESTTEAKEGTYETWKIFHDFKYKLTQAVEDIKTKSSDESKDKSVPRDNSMSDSEENSALKDLDQQSVGDTDNQVSSLESSMQNLSEITQPITAKANDRELSLPIDLKNSESSDDTHKNLVRSESLNGSCDLLDDNILEVESGVEALEHNYTDFNDILEDEADINPNRPKKKNNTKPRTMYDSSNNGKNPNPKNTETVKKNHFNSFSMYILTICLVISYILFPNWSSWNGFLLGLWFYCLVSSAKEWFLDTYMSDEPRKRIFSQLRKSPEMPVMYTIPSVKEYKPLKKYEGWINHYRFPNYDPFLYNINKTTTAFVKLEGCNMRISYTKTKVPKRAFWDEKIENIIFYQHRLYNLTGARVILLPDGLVKRRLWSKKYPLCIILSDKERIQVLEKENMPPEKKETSPEKKNKEQQEESTETSPEKKRKFVWRRREKSVSHSEGESSKEGLRHRFVRKMCKDKKVDSVNAATDTEPEKPEQQDQATQDDESTYRQVKEEEELDENELRRIKEVLDDTEMESITGCTIEGEWSVHVKESKDKHAHLYFFTRTGRDKHDWYRRISTAILEANASAETSATEDKSSSENPDTKDGVEMATYKTSERESVSFSKYTKAFDGETDFFLSKTGQLMPGDLDSYEKTFWPYLHKILQSKAPSPTCDCRMISPEVTWVNTLLARVIYDVTRDPKISNRLQNRVQRKLNTLKLPSFMSPLLVTELSLCGACPLIEHVGGSTFDERGIWLDADLRYDGGALITVLTQINLMKLKDKNITLEDHLSDSEFVVDLDSSLPFVGERFMTRKRKSAVYDSDIEDSAESSSDDESPPLQPIDSSDDLSAQDFSMTGRTSGSSKTKFLKMVDKIATNKYFQQVTDYKYVKRAMEGLSNTDIKLQIEVHGLEGRLVVNLPPPPHDRLWIGFRSNPQLVLKARPAVGARTLRFTQISNWIEQKLSKEFERVLVLPNMEDIIIDLMTPTPVEFE